MNSESTKVSDSASRFQVDPLLLVYLLLAVVYTVAGFNVSSPLTLALGFLFGGVMQWVLDARLERALRAELAQASSYVDTASTERAAAAHGTGEAPLASSGASGEGAEGLQSFRAPTRSEAVRLLRNSIRIDGPGFYTSTPAQVTMDWETFDRFVAAVAEHGWPDAAGAQESS